jgi:hypothetical protein
LKSVSAEDVDKGTGGGDDNLGVRAVAALIANRDAPIRQGRGLGMSLTAGGVAEVDLKLRAGRKQSRGHGNPPTIKKPCARSEVALQVVAGARINLPCVSLLLGVSSGCTSGDVFLAVVVYRRFFVWPLMVGNACSGCNVSSRSVAATCYR